MTDLRTLRRDLDNQINKGKTPAWKAEQIFQRAKQKQESERDMDPLSIARQAMERLGRVDDNTPIPLNEVYKQLNTMVKRGEIEEGVSRKIWDEITQGGKVDAATMGYINNIMERYGYKGAVVRTMRNERMDPFVTMDMGRIMQEYGSIVRMNMDGRMMFQERVPEDPKVIDRKALEEARELLVKQNEILNRIKEDALILHKVDRISKDGKHTFVEKQGTMLRIKAPEGLKVGHEVLLHPKTMGIVEDLGFPPLEASPFSPGEIPNVTWDDIAGCVQAKADLIEAIEMPHKYRELYKFYGKRPVKGVLLSGDPGCGKTMLAKAAANSLAGIYGAESAKTGFLYIKGPEILNQYVGQTEQTIREIFIDAARHHAVHGYPAIVMIDEADAILAARGTRALGITNTIVPQFLTEMDGMEDSHAVVILATNRPDVLDPAIIREGRIDRKVHVSRPDLETAIAIAKLNFAKYPISNSAEANDLATGMAHELFRVDRFVGDDKLLKSIISGAMIASCVDLAVASAMRRDIEAKALTDGFSGLRGEDVIVAVDRIQSQNHGMSHDFA